MWEAIDRARIIKTTTISWSWLFVTLTKTMNILWASRNLWVDETGLSPLSRHLWFAIKVKTEMLRNSCYC